jgi:hypothetical protein
MDWVAGSCVEFRRRGGQYVIVTGVSMSGRCQIGMPDTEGNFRVQQVCVLCVLMLGLLDLGGGDPIRQVARVRLAVPRCVKLCRCGLFGTECLGGVRGKPVGALFVHSAVHIRIVIDNNNQGKYTPREVSVATYTSPVAGSCVNCHSRAYSAAGAGSYDVRVPESSKPFRGNIGSAV